MSKPLRSQFSKRSLGIGPHKSKASTITTKTRPAKPKKENKREKRNELGDSYLRTFYIPINKTLERMKAYTLVHTPIL